MGKYNVRIKLLKQQQHLNYTQHSHNLPFIFPKHLICNKWILLFLLVSNEVFLYDLFLFLILSLTWTNIGP